MILFIPFHHFDKHLDGAWDTFWIKSRNGTFSALQMKAFGPKKMNFMQGLKSAILAIFQSGLGWLCPVSPVLNNPSQELKKYFWFGCLLSINPYKVWNAKLERPHFLKVQSGKITVWVDLDLTSSIVEILPAPLSKKIKLT